MSETTLGGLYLNASERNAQRIADLQAEIDALRTQLDKGKGASTMDDTQPTLTTLEWGRQKMMSRHDDGYGAPAIVIAFAQAEALTRCAIALESIADTLKNDYITVAKQEW